MRQLTGFIIMRDKREKLRRDPVSDCRGQEKIDYFPTLFAVGSISSEDVGPVRGPAGSWGSQIWDWQVWRQWVTRGWCRTRGTEDIEKDPAVPNCLSEPEFELWGTDISNESPLVSTRVPNGVDFELGESVNPIFNGLDGSQFLQPLVFVPADPRLRDGLVLSQELELVEFKPQCGIGSFFLTSRPVEVPAKESDEVQVVGDESF